MSIFLGISSIFFAGAFAAAAIVLRAASLNLSRLLVFFAFLTGLLCLYFTPSEIFDNRPIALFPIVGGLYPLSEFCVYTFAVLTLCLIWFLKDKKVEKKIHRIIAAKVLFEIIFGVVMRHVLLGSMDEILKAAR